MVLLHCFQGSNPGCVFHQDLCLNCAYVGQSSPSQLTPSIMTSTAYIKVSLSWAAPSDLMCAATAAGTFSVHIYSFFRACQRLLSSKKTFRFVRHPLLGPRLQRRINCNEAEHHVSTEWCPQPRDCCQDLSRPEGPCSHLRFPSLLTGKFAEKDVRSIICSPHVSW